MSAAFSHWSASWPVLAGYVLVASAHLAGMRRLLAVGGSEAAAAGAARQELRREALMFHVGLLIVALALVSPIGYLSTIYIWVRALQTLLVAVVGPGLIVLGAPWPAFRQLGRRALAATPGSGQSADRGAGHVSFPVSLPAMAVITFNVIFVAWQIPVLSDAAHVNGGVALVEHATLLAVGLLFWLQLISSRPFSQRTAPLRRMGFVVATAVVWTILGMVLVFGSGVLYSGYANSAHHIVTVLDDQQLAGAILWMGILPPLIVAGVALMLTWFNNEESAELSADLDRLLTPRRHGWPSRPVIR